MVWGGLWLVTVIAGLSLRPPLPVDETRYLSVAWEMWLSGDFLVPHLNGETYSHKPPLLFWIMQAGWTVFGVVEWWPRLVAPLFALASLFLTGSLARALWPDRPAIADWAPVILVGSVFWALFQTLTMFDTLLAAFTLLALLGLVRFWRGGHWRWIAVAGLAIGLGVLAKGPAILLHVLPVALTAPLWAPGLGGGGLATTMRWRRWYGGVGVAVLLGVALALAWAVPAGIAGGEAYRNAIFWGQSAGRMVNSFAHARPFWWYAAVLPGLLLPWAVWLPAWRALRMALSPAGKLLADGGVRLCLIWFAVAVAAFSAISGKQLHYLLPEFPALALIVARLVTTMDEAKPVRRMETWLPAIPLVLAGAAVAIAPYAPIDFRKPYWFDVADAGWGLLAVMVGVIAASCWRARSEIRLAALATLSPALVLVIHFGAADVVATFYDLHPLARQIKAWQVEGIPVAHFGKYHAQYHFLGRLNKPIPVIGVTDGDQAAFVAAHPNGRVISLHDRLPTVAKPVAAYSFRRRFVAVWEVTVIKAHPRITHRD